MDSLPPEQASLQPDKPDCVNDVSGRHELFARSPVARYLNLASICTDGVFVTDAHGKVLFANEALLSVLGYRRDDQLVGQPFPTDHWVEPGQGDALWGEVLREGVIRDRPIELLDRENRTRFISLSAACTQDESGEVIDVQFALRDRTGVRIKANEFERQRDALRQVRAGAHELNQPLTVIVGYSSLLLRLSGPEDANRRILENIARSAQEIKEIVRRVGQIARDASGDPHLSEETM